MSREMNDLIYQYQKHKKAADALEQQIKEYFLEKKDGFENEVIKINYNKGRKTYEYELSGQVANSSIIAQCSKSVIDWKEVCKKSGITPTFKTGNPSVTVKLK